MNDDAHMRAALAMAARGLGQTWPNPSVGCVIVKDGRVIGRGVTGVGGRPHGETQALAAAGEAARGATAYITLEPCAHWGRTPPCADTLVTAGITRVVVALGDPDPRVNGAGLKRLREAGVEVVEGVLRAEAEHISAGFLARIRHGRPMVTLKLASTLDGRIATRTGESKWISGEPARKAAHMLRATHDAILVGVGTVVADDPELTCRIQGARQSELIRVVADSHLRTGLSTRLVATARQTPTWILHRDGADPARIKAMRAAGVNLLQVDHTAAGLDLSDALRALAGEGITRLMVEGGAQIAASLLRADLVDRLVWAHAPTVMGGDGWPAAQAFGFETLAEIPRFRRIDTRPCGDDVLTEMTRIGRRETH